MIKIKVIKKGGWTGTLTHLVASIPTNYGSITFVDEFIVTNHDKFNKI